MSLTDLTFQDPKSLVNRAAFNDRFSVLNGLYQYWWKRTEYEYKEKKTLSTYGKTTISENNAIVTYSSSISLDQKTGKITLVDPIRGGVNLEQASQGKLRNKYAIYNGAIYFFDENTKYNMYNAYLQASSYYAVTAVKQETSDYVFSDNRSTYPDSGEQDGYEYEYLGVPFENARGAPKVVIGSYVGTGTHGSGNPNELIFDYVPKIVILFRDDGTPTMPYYWGAPKIVIENGRITYYCTATVGNDPVKLNFYSDDDAYNQFNSIGEIYTYFALC